MDSELLQLFGTVSASVGGICALTLAGLSLQRIVLSLLSAGVGAVLLGNLMNDPVGLHSGYVVTVPDTFSWLGARLGALIGFSAVVVLTWLPPRPAERAPS